MVMAAKIAAIMETPEIMDSLMETVGQIITVMETKGVLADNLMEMAVKDLIIMEIRIIVIMETKEIILPMEMAVRDLIIMATKITVIMEIRMVIITITDKFCRIKKNGYLQWGYLLLLFLMKIYIIEPEENSHQNGGLICQKKYYCFFLLYAW